MGWFPPTAHFTASWQYQKVHTYFIHNSCLAHSRVVHRQLWILPQVLFLFPWRLFQPWSTLLRNWQILAVTHPGYVAFLVSNVISFFFSSPAPKQTKLECSSPTSLFFNMVYYLLARHCPCPGLPERQTYILDSAESLARDKHLLILSFKMSWGLSLGLFVGKARTISFWGERLKGKVRL